MHGWLANTMDWYNTKFHQPCPIFISFFSQRTGIIKRRAALHFYLSLHYYLALQSSFTVPACFFYLLHSLCPPRSGLLAAWQSPVTHELIVWTKWKINSLRSSDTIMHYNINLGEYSLYWFMNAVLYCLTALIHYLKFWPNAVLPLIINQNLSLASISMK